MEMTKTCYMHKSIPPNEHHYSALQTYTSYKKRKRRKKGLMSLQRLVAVIWDPQQPSLPGSEVAQPKVRMGFPSWHALCWAFSDAGSSSCCRASSL